MEPIGPHVGILALFGVLLLTEIVIKRFSAK